MVVAQCQDSISKSLSEGVYEKEIFYHLRTQEHEHFHDKSLTWSSSPCRSVGVNAIIYLTRKLKIDSEGVHLATNIFDQFFMCCKPLDSITVRMLLCYVLVSFNIARKYIGETDDRIDYNLMIYLLSITDVKLWNLIALELEVAQTIDWNFLIPNMHSFLPQYMLISNQCKVVIPLTDQHTRSVTNAVNRNTSPARTRSNKRRHYSVSTSFLEDDIIWTSPLPLSTLVKTADNSTLSFHIQSLKQIYPNIHQTSHDEIVECISERMLLIKSFIRIPMSKLAATCILLTRCIFKYTNVWTNELYQTTYYSYEDLHPILCHFLESIHREYLYFQAYMVYKEDMNYRYPLELDHTYFKYLPNPYLADTLPPNVTRHLHNVENHMNIVSSNNMTYTCTCTCMTTSINTMKAIKDDNVTYITPTTTTGDTQESTLYTYVTPSTCTTEEADGCSTYVDSMTTYITAPSQPPVIHMYPCNLHVHTGNTTTTTTTTTNAVNTKLNMTSDTYDSSCSDVMYTTPSKDIPTTTTTNTVKNNRRKRKNRKLINQDHLGCCEYKLHVHTTDTTTSTNGNTVSTPLSRKEIEKIHPYMWCGHKSIDNALPTKYPYAYQCIMLYMIHYYTHQYNY